MISDDSSRIDQILKQILTITADIHGVLIMDREGIPITGLTPAGALDSAITQQLSALNGAIFESAIDQGTTLDLGAVELQMVEYARGYMFTRGVGNGVLLVFTTKNVDIIAVIKNIKNYDESLCAILNDYICVDEPSLSDDMKTLLKSEFVNFEQ